MTRARRWWLAALAALVLLPLVAAVLLLWLVDPNSLRPAIERQARERFGVPLQLRGPLRWSLWPALAVDSGDGALGDATGAPPPVSWHALRFTLQWPARKNRDWTLEGVLVDGLQVRLKRDAQGRWNVASLLAANAPAALPAGASPGAAGPAIASTAPPRIASLRIEPLRLHDARIEWQVDDATPPWVVSGLDASVRIEADEAFDHWTLRDLQLDGHVTGAPLASAQPLSIRAARVEYRDGGQPRETRIDADPATARWAGAALHVSLARPLVLAPLGGEGEIDVQGDSLRSALVAHRVDVPPMRSDATLRRYALSGHWRVTQDDVSLGALQAQLDDTHWQGSASGRWRAPQAWRIAVTGDTLDVDRYRRPESDPGAPFELPVAALRGLPLTGTVQLRELRAAGSVARDARITLQ